MASTQHDVFLTGGTGFMGSSLARELLRRGHRVRALVRPGSESKLAAGCEPVRGDALRAESYASQIAPADTFVHLVGVAHPNPRKAAEFRAIDLKSCQEAVHAAVEAGVRHFVYLSVARPAPIMQEYQAARAEGERLIRESGMSSDLRASLVCAGAGTQLAVRAYSVVCVGKVVSSDARRRATARPGDSATDDAGFGVGGGESPGRCTDHRAAADASGLHRAGDAPSQGCQPR